METKDIFEGFEPTRYEAETAQRWGDTEAFRESRRRTQRYDAEDWKRFFAEQQAIHSDLHAALLAGQAPADPAVQAVVERHRLSIDRWFYPCDSAMHCKLAALYESDPRFQENIDKHGKGLTAFLVAAIREGAGSATG